MLQQLSTVQKLLSQLCLPALSPLPQSAWVFFHTSNSKVVLYVTGEAAEAGESPASQQYSELPTSPLLLQCIPVFQA